MLRLFKVLVVLVIVLAVVLVGLQLFLNHALTPAVQKALPEVNKTLGVDVAVGDLSINLLGGSLTADSIRIANPKGFKERDVFTLERTVLDVGLLALTKGILEVSEATVKDAWLTLIRNGEGDVNVAVIREGLPQPKPTGEPKPPAAPTPETPKPPPAKATRPAEMPKVQINQLAFNTLFEFIDHKTEKPEPNRVCLELAIAAQDVSTFVTGPEAKWGTVKISGSLRDKPEVFVTDISAGVAPLTDPLRASFTANGNIMAIDMRELGALSDEIGVASQSVDLTLNLTVRDGDFIAGSELVAALHNAELVGDLKKKHDGVKLPPEISLTIPVSGTLAKPVISIQQAITVSVLRNLAKNPDYILDNVTVDGKSLRQRLNKALGGEKKDAKDGGSSGEDVVEDTLKQLKGLFK